ncbi:GNAT family N-acetyltransferase [Azospirillum brasilense]|uniref:GNAT family N-acetyltransferase n=1 Tax=Azospirillum brasilense TaxID=192 RepID=A0A6L3B0J2_AZOBR|nr:GNAT family N-acetyltransferase [Azospirillum brasilense]KAA0685690.1 GNAT family N-acetyltransferase [Azospirillum brasilense]
MTDIRVRKAGLADAGVVTGFVAALLSELSAGQNDTPRAVMLAVAESLLDGAGDSYTVFLAEDAAGRPLGVATLSEGVCISTLGRFGTIRELYVKSESRSAGVGRVLIRAVLDHGRRHRWSRVEVGAPSAADWPDSLRFYKREGFTEIGPRLKFRLA